jgi:hypothetical protein
MFLMRCKNMETDGSIDSRKKEVEPSYRRLSIPS